MSNYENIVLIFSLIRTVFYLFIYLFLFCFSIYKIVDSEYSTDNYKSPKISIGAVMKNPEMFKFVSDHLKTKKMYKHAVTFCESVHDLYINKKMCN